MSLRCRLKMSSQAVEKWFTHSATFILVIAGSAKIWSAFGDVKLLAVIDPIIGISFRYLMLVVGSVELIVAAVCLLARSGRAIVPVVWLATCFGAYRLGLWWMGWKSPCGCLGSVVDALSVPAEVAERAMSLALGYLLVGGYGISFWKWMQRGRMHNGECPC